MEYCYLVFFLFAPAGVMWLCKKLRWMGKIGPILILYILGIVLGNLSFVPGLPSSLSHPKGLSEIQNLLTSAMVPIAIPLMLYGCTFLRSETRNQLVALICGIVAIVCSVVAGFFIFHSTIDSSTLVTASAGSTSTAKIGGMLTGVYTGGTVNLASLQTMLGVGSETYLLLNSYDMVISFLFLSVLVAGGIRLLRRFLPYVGTPFFRDTQIEEYADSTKPARFSGKWFRQAGILIGITAAIVGVSAGIALLLPQEWFMTAFILMLTTLGIAASFNKQIRSLRIADDIGMYCIYVFSITVASMADIKAMDFSGSLGILGYLTLVIFGSLLIQILLAKILKIDADTVIITATSFICSPPFVPMMAAAMKNRRVVIGGLTSGIIGYAIGTYLGFAISKILELF